jgi:hypothetical protein
MEGVFFPEKMATSTFYPFFLPYQPQIHDYNHPSSGNLIYPKADELNYLEFELRLNYILLLFQKPNLLMFFFKGLLFFLLFYYPFLFKLSSLIISTNDALIIPVGTATTPIKAIIDPNILPANVIGYISSKPTPVKEATAPQKEGLLYLI